MVLLLGGGALLGSMDTFESSSPEYSKLIQECMAAGPTFEPFNLVEARLMKYPVMEYMVEETGLSNKLYSSGINRIASL